MLSRIAATFGALVFLAGIVAINVHFTRQEEAIRVEARRAVTAARARNAERTAQHLKLDCVVINPAQ